MGFFSIEALGLKTALGFAEVPSPVTTTVNTLLVALPSDALAFFFPSNSDMEPFFLASDADLPFLEGVMSGISYQRHFAPIVIPFAAEVDFTAELALLDPPASWTSFFKIIFLT